MTNAHGSSINLRNLCLTMLLEVEKGAKSHIVLKRTLDENEALDKQQRAFLTRLFQGTIERQIELDYIIDCFSKTKTKKMKPVIRGLLRMSVYQIKYMDSVPDSAVCNEAVKLANKRKFSSLKGFVNGVLRNISREIDNVPEPANRNGQLAIKYSVPLWIIEMWQQQFGEGQTEKILEGIYNELPTTVRVNKTKATVQDVINNLEYNNVTVERSGLLDEVLFISDYDKLEDLDVFKAGMITVQNLSSILVGIAASPKKGDNVIDVCAAPGGKSLHMAELLEGTGMVSSRDLTQYKVDLIDENIRRIGYKNIHTKVWDATALDDESVDMADIVIADLPCSGLGVIGNKSDIKYNISSMQLEELSVLQKEILKTVSSYVKVGGRLVYSTCTINKSENHENVDWILGNLPFKLVDLSDVMPEQIKVENGFVQVMPGQYYMDGFFIAVFERGN